MSTRGLLAEMQANSSVYLTQMAAKLDTDHERQWLDAALQGALSILQDRMAEQDMLRRPSRAGRRGMEILLKGHRLLKLRMDANRNHPRAHLHIDYHHSKHMASYAIDNSELLAGDGSYDRVVKPWIAEHQANLMQVWRGLRANGVDDAIVAELRGSTL
ncbi:DUF4160 domain-containing protein [Mesorhizobium helmanticense]|uniref:DUF4160 domain-containing protein n=1 Tax=Mesorhizobium helmanticense TaxID=1776423 RepID=A0A2T4IM24_9HYPH|nr:DUF4160 domain-containing protein [Mesorhizobium helmanticense]PTE06670.1 hypothetical protein C9427_30360 [Mesorhizobium helmanticense]